MTIHRPPPEGWLDQIDDFGPDWGLFHERKTAMKGWRTLAFSAATALLGVASAFDWTSVLAGPWGGWVVMGLGAVGAALRVVTNTPAGQSK